VERFDVVVAGGGTAGCVLAARLSEDPERSVCLVEAGPDYGPHDLGGWPADLLDARRLAFSHSWETDRDDRSQLRARVLGGCSTHNACVALRGAPQDYDEWGHGWSYTLLEPYFARAERALRVGEQSAPLSAWHGAFVEAAPEDAFLHPVNEVGGVRWSTAFAYLDPARRRPNLTIRADALVDRVVHVDGLVAAVVTTTGELQAGAVVLAAGAYGTPGILLRSGIGNDDLPVGENLGDHVGAGMAWDPTEELRRALPDGLPMAQVTIRGRSASCVDAAWDTFLFPALDDAPGGGYEISAAAFAMKTRSRGRVRLHDADPRTPLAIEHGFLSDPVDADVVAEGIDRLRELARSPAVSRFAARELRPGAGVDALDHVRATARGFFHPVGTCALGLVAEPNGRVRGFDNLYVGDASFIPTVPSVNTNLTVAAVAERLSELI
jgi:choline dehydrogenase-like flavoprotein